MSTPKKRKPPKVSRFKICPNCGKRGYRAIIRKRDGAPIMKCIYCGFEGKRNG